MAGFLDLTRSFSLVTLVEWGRGLAWLINQAETDKRLTESRQFGAYNRLTAFLMHDLNNVIAQQSLVVKKRGALST